MDAQNNDLEELLRSEVVARDDSNGRMQRALVDNEEMDTIKQQYMAALHQRREQQDLDRAVIEAELKVAKTKRVAHAYANHVNAKVNADDSVSSESPPAPMPAETHKPISALEEGVMLTQKLQHAEALQAELAELQGMLSQVHLATKQQQPSSVGGSKKSSKKK
jgi:hypothetical protein